MKYDIYFFEKGNVEIEKIDKMELGGKGANLCIIAKIGIPVPPGIVIPTKYCHEYLKQGGLPDDFMDFVLEKLKLVETSTGRTFGGSVKPLLVSVRSGAPVSMPGMMDTILNLGMNEETIKALILETKDERFVYDSYRRFVQMFGDIVLGVPHDEFEKILDGFKKLSNAASDTDLTPEVLKEIVKSYKDVIKKYTKQDFPDNVVDQLRMSIEAVFRSWNNERAIIYRKIHSIPESYGTAVNIQAMVFGNMGFDSATGVCFTRNPSTGEKRFYGEYLLNAQGEDVVAGIRTPENIENLQFVMPEVYQELYQTTQRLEEYFKDMQDIEFTVEKRKLYILQTRSGKRTARAALKIAYDMVKEGLITPKEAITRVDPESLPSVMTPIFDPVELQAAKNNGHYLTKGLNAGPGAASGKIVLTSEKAVELAAKGEKVLLVRTETSPDDIKGMQYSEGILTSRGGMTSHAAVVARAMNKPCVVGCSDIAVFENHIEVVTFDGRRLCIREGNELSIDGTTGEVLLGKIKTIPSEIIRVLTGEIPKEESEIATHFLQIMEWADMYRKIGVRANADTPLDAKMARILGAKGIGLCRTEHMFFGEERLPLMQKMILSKTSIERKEVLKELKKFQKEDFVQIFKEMEGYPVTIRLLDPPLHEFLPMSDEDAQHLSMKIGIPVEEIIERRESLREMNPMLGHRGCRLGITYPEITEMQVEAIIEAAIECKRTGMDIYPEIMVPLVGNKKELELQREIIEKTAKRVMKEQNMVIHYEIGTMIEVPRAAITADEIAEVADFFSYGTNDLTQMTLGFSRDDAEVFLREYIRLGIYEKNPFETIDVNGVGELVKMATQKGKARKASLKCGVCGEHGGDTQSVYFFAKIPLDYVSASPYRVPIARLAGAIIAVKE
ncbi:MAG: pyruvate, phosphate dikinase [Leptospiraceae bacterium]|nr:pyruvate, phosphate dikinase [Leptospiraceae bacterium]MDW7977114.1 pyruvate, phosphate dikinase [Leptospiraceae bacterium]